MGWSSVNANSVHGFRWSGGTLTDLGTLPGGGYSRAHAINDAGQVAGVSDRSPGGYGYPVKWSATGAITDLGGPITNRLGEADGIDPTGRIAGGQRPASSSGSAVGIVYAADGTPTELGGNLGLARGINARGQVVGGPGYIWQNGTVTALPGLPGSLGNQSTVAYAINVGGQVVGASSNGSALRAVRWPTPTTITDLGTVDGITSSTARAINAAGQVVGTADPNCSPCVSPRAWLWQPGSTITALDTLIPAGSGWTLREANGINDLGQIVGTGIHNGHQRAFLLTPTYHVNINFQPAGSPVPTGYLADTGAVYGARGGGLSYGWNIDNSVNARDRNLSASPDQRYDTLNHTQKAGGASVWELGVPNGSYLVHLVSGDPCCTDSVFKLAVEGTLAVSGTPTATTKWFEGTVRVTVTDGRITVTNAAGASNSKLTYIDIQAA